MTNVFAIQTNTFFIKVPINRFVQQQKINKINYSNLMNAKEILQI